MITTNGNLFDRKYWAEVSAEAVCITTNGVLRSNGHAVMGAGNAKQASLLWPFLPDILGQMIKDSGNHVYHLATDFFNFRSTSILSFPTKEHWKDPSVPELIVRSAQELLAMAEAFAWKRVLLPPPGCGLGGMRWSEVNSLLSPILDDRFTVVFLKR